MLVLQLGDGNNSSSSSHLLTTLLRQVLLFFRLARIKEKNMRI